jgi:hypothetical protein
MLREADHFVGERCVYLIPGPGGKGIEGFFVTGLEDDAPKDTP